MDACWSFNATSHGKVVCGGIGGTVKRTVAKKNLQCLPIDKNYKCPPNVLVLLWAKQLQDKKTWQNRQVWILNYVFDGILLKGAESSTILQRLEPSLHNYVACVYEENWWIELVSGLNLTKKKVNRILRPSLQATVLFRLHHSNTSACGEKGVPLHYATSCHMTLSYHFTKPSTENTQLWWKSVLSNQPSRINIAKLISFLTDNENLIKQPPDATSSSDPHFSPSPRLQTYGLRLSRGSIPRTLISLPTSI
ncbi:hypothetical protein AVEN_90913-1 [Araneus ventricosus]|uniref:Uncharacterized protein n=1 Tax=Araneus ventricosus TaxID=182803 RepID=A0A4Y2JK29_ARAVE|nr:hypothetical protein AVEN_90913-1 [Araneus ventricosus]